MKQVIHICLLFLANALSAQSQTKNYIDQPYMDVIGYADSLVIPNEIYIKINISERDTKDKISVEEAESKMVDGLKTLGIDTEKDLTTSDLESNFRFYFPKQKDVLKSKQYILKVGDAISASKIFIMLEDLGISNTSIDRVGHSELESIKNSLRIKAVENAKQRAIALTKPLNQTVGQAIYLSDNEASSNVESALQGRLQGVVVTGYGSKLKNGIVSPKIDFEKIKLVSTVSVKFILK